MSVAVTIVVVTPRPVRTSVWGRFAPTVAPARSACVRGLVAGPSTPMRPGVPPHSRRDARRPLPRHIPGGDSMEGSVGIQIP